MPIPTTTPLGTKVKWGGGAAPIQYGTTSQQVRDGKVVITDRHNLRVIAVDADINELDVDTDKDDVLPLLRMAYEAWMTMQGLELASADEVLNGDNLSSFQRQWLMRFWQIWDLTERAM